MPKIRWKFVIVISILIIANLIIWLDVIQTWRNTNSQNGASPLIHRLPRFAKSADVRGGCDGVCLRFQSLCFFTEIVRQERGRTIAAFRFRMFSLVLSLLKRKYGSTTRLHLGCFAFMGALPSGLMALNSPGMVCVNSSPANSTAVISEQSQNLDLRNRQLQAAEAMADVLPSRLMVLDSPGVLYLNSRYAKSAAVRVGRSVPALSFDVFAKDQNLNRNFFHHGQHLPRAVAGSDFAGSLPHLFQIQLCGIPKSGISFFLFKEKEHQKTHARLRVINNPISQNPIITQRSDIPHPIRKNLLSEA